MVMMGVVVSWWSYACPFVISTSLAWCYSCISKLEIQWVSRLLSGIVPEPAWISMLSIHCLGSYFVPPGINQALVLQSLHQLSDRGMTDLPTCCVDLFSDIPQAQPWLVGIVDLLQIRGERCAHVMGRVSLRCVAAPTTRFREPSRLGSWWLLLVGICRLLRWVCWQLRWHLSRRCHDWSYGHVRITQSHCRPGGMRACGAGAAWVELGEHLGSTHADVERPDRNMLYAGGAIKLANIEGPNGLICPGLFKSQQ